MERLYYTFFIFLVSVFATAQESEAIVSGVSWFDQNNQEVNAHGICVVKEGDKYYLFGEYKSDTINAFTGFSCYSSSDMVNWKFEKIVLPVQQNGLLGPNRIGERVKVMKSPTTGEFVMYMHCDDLKYNDPHVGYATSKNIDGDYEFQGDLLHNGKYLRKWDLGSFQDSDGVGYLLTHEGFIYKLSPDYKSVESVVASNITKGGESPAMFKNKDLYYWLFSNKTSWERNDNYYLTAKSLEGPWLNRGLFAPEGSLTWNSQCSFVLPLVVNETDTLNIYMGDRWSFPKQGSAATQVWQPITVSDSTMSIPEFYDTWHYDTKTGYREVDIKLKSIKGKLKKEGQWKLSGNELTSNQKGDQVTIPFNGS